jgi:hypothetical protein
MTVGDLDPRGFDRELEEWRLGSSDDPRPGVVYAGVSPRVRSRRRRPLRCRLGWHAWRERKTAGVEQCVRCGDQRAPLWGAP